MKAARIIQLTELPPGCGPCPTGGEGKATSTAAKREAR
jgi:hypothetical protein